MSADTLLSRLQKVKPTGPGRWMAACPAHKDRTASLLITEKPDGKTTIYCFALCDRLAILESVGLKWKDLFPPRSESYVCQPVDRDSFRAADVLAAAADDLTFAYIVMSDLQKWLANENEGQPPGPDVRARFLASTARLHAAAGIATGRTLDAEEEREDIIAAGVLTPEEEAQLRAFPTADFGNLCNPVADKKKKEPANAT